MSTNRANLSKLDEAIQGNFEFQFENEIQNDTNVDNKLFVPNTSTKGRPKSGSVEMMYDKPQDHSENTAGQSNDLNQEKTPVTLTKSVHESESHNETTMNS